MNTQNSLGRLQLLAAALIVSLSVPAFGAPFTMVTSGNFNTGANWSPASVPGTLDDTIFNNTAPTSMLVNNTNKSATSTQTGSIGLNLSVGVTWTLTDSFSSVSNNSTGNNVFLSNGNLFVTNGGGTAQATFGGAGATEYANLYMQNAAYAKFDHLTIYSKASGTGKGLTMESTSQIDVLNGSTLNFEQAIGAQKLRFLGGTNTIQGTAGTQLNVGVNAVGLLTVDGAGNTLSANKFLRIGATGANSAGSTFTISGGAQMTNAGDIHIGAGSSASASNSMTVTGIGSKLTLPTAANRNLSIGDQGSSNTLLVSSGGEVDLVGNELRVGNGTASASNVVTVTGSGSIFRTTSAVYAGYQGDNNQLLVTNGGQLIASAVVAGLLAVSTGNSVSATNGGLIESNSLQAGSSGTGTVTASSGGIFQFTNASPSISVPGGTVTVNGGIISFRGVTGTTLATPKTNLTYAGDNTLRLNSSTNTLANYTFQTGTPSNYATLELINNSTWNASATINVGNGGLINVAAGSTIGGAGTMTVASGGTLMGSGTINVATTVAGTHSPGSSPGIQTFGSSLTYSGGASVVNWELNSNTITNAANPNAVFDTMLVSGNLNFANATALNLSFIATGSNVLWANSFWDTSHTGTNGWLVYDVTGTTSNFNNLSVSTSNWLDSSSVAFNTARPNTSFSLFQDGNDVYLNYTVNPVPEPSTCLLAILGISVSIFRRKRSG